MKQVRAILSDFGGVLYKTPDLRWVVRAQHWLHKRLSAERRARMQRLELLAGLYASPSESEHAFGLMTGQIPEEEVWNEIAGWLRLKPEWLRRIRRHSVSARRLNQPMIQLLRSLRPRYKTAILSNAASEFRDTFCRAYGMEEWVDEVIISAEEGLAKPDLRLYNLALERLGVQPAEAIFIDDVAENVEAAREAGMHAYHFQNNQQALAWLRQKLA